MLVDYAWPAFLADTGGFVRALDDDQARARNRPVSWGRLQWVCPQLAVLARRSGSGARALSARVGCMLRRGRMRLRSACWQQAQDAPDKCRH